MSPANVRAHRAPPATGENTQATQPRFQSPCLFPSFLLALGSSGRDVVYFRIVTFHSRLKESGLNNIELPEDETMLSGVSSQEMDRLLRCDWCCFISPSVSLVCRPVCLLPGGSVVLLLHVDDILLTGSDNEQVLHVNEKLNGRFEAVDLGQAKFFLGMGIHRNVHARAILCSQETYARTILETYGMNNAHPMKTPAEHGPVKRKKFCQQRTPRYSGLPRNLSLILAGAQGRILLVQLFYLREACQHQVRER